MKYLFVLSAEGGWWLKIDTIEQLIDYHKKTDGHRYEKALWNFFHGVKPEDLLKKAQDSKNPEDLIALYANRDFQYMQAALMQASQAVEEKRLTVSHLKPCFLEAPFIQGCCTLCTL